VKHINVLHLTDTLDAGGAERMAVNLVNMLPRERYRPHLCTTRREGVLADTIAADVKRLRLNRTWRFDAQALRTLARYIDHARIDILHAHGTALFIAVLASRYRPHSVIVWHDHYGRCLFDDRPVWLYRLAGRYVKGIIAVNQVLAAWAHDRLGVPKARIRYIPNFVMPGQEPERGLSLSGIAESRIVCVANFRPEKDHFTLVRALMHVVRACPTVQLLLVGAPVDPDYLSRVQHEIERCGLTQHVSILGTRNDVPAILKACSIGVLSSASEGLPLSLLEYGSAGLPVVATKVGQCAEVLAEGAAGLLVPPGEPTELARMLISLLRSAERRTELGARFRQRVKEAYSPDAALRQVCEFYEEIMESSVKAEATISSVEGRALYVGQPGERS
jgi:glycosyltransferase involved in cell wall biosynthesis